jgi:DeoR/GlpR family transcriptional regulator of sugar metabolism
MVEGVRSELGRRGGMLAEARRAAIVRMLRADGSVAVADIEGRFGVSPMTARRDLAELERHGEARRTHGGAVLPGVPAGEDSFGRRIERDTAAKAALAAAAVGRIGAGEAVFLDSSSTAFFVARGILDRGIAVTLLTNSLPIAEIVAAQAGPNVELVSLGGTLRRVSRSFVGPQALESARAHFADRAFMSCTGVTHGVLTEADPLEADLKRTMIAQAAASTILLDRGKLSARGLNAIAPVAAVGEIVAHGLTAGEVEELRAAGATVDLATAA